MTTAKWTINTREQQDSRTHTHFCLINWQAACGMGPFHSTNVTHTLFTCQLLVAQNGLVTFGGGTMGPLLR